MQLTSKDGNMVVDFYPQGTTKKRYTKCVTFANDVKSYSTIIAMELKHEVRNRIELGYEVTDFNTEECENYRPMMC